MKKTLIFIPLGIGISAAILYILSIVSYRIINGAEALNQILSNIRIYLCISILGFFVYFFIRLLLYFRNKKTGDYNVDTEDKYDEDDDNLEVNKINAPIIEAYEPLKFIDNKDDHVCEKKEDAISKKIVISEKKDGSNKKININYKYCPCCGEKLYSTDKFCNNCGTNQLYKKQSNKHVRLFINILEIIILLLIIYFSINMLFDYKEKIDPDFKSPFKVSMTK